MVAEKAHRWRRRIGGFGPFKDIGANISLDEDVISGEPNEPPVMTLNISVPDGTLVALLAWSNSRSSTTKPAESNTSSVAGRVRPG